MLCMVHILSDFLQFITLFYIYISYLISTYIEKKVCQKTKDDKEFPCPHCNKVFTTEKRLSNHIGKCDKLSLDCCGVLFTIWIS